MMLTRPLKLGHGVTFGTPEASLNWNQKFLTVLRVRMLILTSIWRLEFTVKKANLTYGPRQIYMATLIQLTLTLSFMLLSKKQMSIIGQVSISSLMLILHTLIFMQTSLMFMQQQTWTKH